MRELWTLRLRWGVTREVIGFALWRNPLLFAELLRCVGLAGQPTGITPLSRCRDFGISNFESGLRGRYCALLFGAIGCSCLGCFDWLSRLLNPQARRLPRHSGTPRRCRFDKFIRRMNLPGTTHLSAFGHSKAVCFETRLGSSAGTRRDHRSKFCSHAGKLPTRLQKRLRVGFVGAAGTKAPAIAHVDFEFVVAQVLEVCDKVPIQQRRSMDPDKSRGLELLLHID